MIKLQYRFESYPSSHTPGSDTDEMCFVTDKWNDFGYYVTFHANLYLHGRRTDLGFVSIGFDENNEESDATDTFKVVERHGDSGRTLEYLPEYLFSVGTLSYYQALWEKLHDEQSVRDYLVRSRDMPYNSTIYDDYSELQIMRDAMLRSVSRHSFTQFRRVALGGTENISFNWEVSIRTKDEDDERTLLTVQNDVDSKLPSNLFAVIGNNGIGKTSLLKDLADAAHSHGEFVDSRFLDGKEIRIKSGVAAGHSNEQIDGITNIVFVSFSSFDTYDWRFEELFRLHANYRFLGSRIAPFWEHDEEITEKNSSINKLTDPRTNGSELESNLEKLFSKPQPRKLFDTIFERFSWDTELSYYIDQVRGRVDKLASAPEKAEIQQLADQLSSGQKIVIAMMYHLVEVASENALLLIDEPELYLHPPYALALILAINDLATQTNSACIFTTHSAITLQEIPRENVFWVQATSAGKSVVHPKQQTFGMDTQTINDEIFGVGIRDTGYYQILTQLANMDADSLDTLLKEEKLGRRAVVFLNAIRRAKSNVQSD